MAWIWNSATEDDCDDYDEALKDAPIDYRDYDWNFQ